MRTTNFLSTGHWRGASLAAVTAVTLAMSVLFAPGATADDQTALSLPDSTVSAGVDAGDSTTDLTLPAGTSASSLSAKLALDTTTPGGTVQVSLTGGGQTRTENFDAGTLNAEIHFDGLPAALTRQTTSGSTLHLAVRLDSAQSTSTAACAPLPKPNTATVSGIRVGLTGNGTDVGTVRDFVRGPATQVFVLAEHAQNRAIQQGVLQATAAAAKIWPGTSTTVQVVSALPSTLTPAYPGAIRVIEIATGKESTQTVTEHNGIPQITLTGNATQLDKAARGLTSAAARIADSNNTTDLQATTTTTGTSHSFAALGLGTVQLSGFGTSQAYLDVPQSGFGGPVSKFRIHLTGAHTSIPAGVVARANVLWNNHLVASFPLEKTSNFSHDVTIPASRITAQNSLTVVLNAASTGTIRCAGALRGLDLRLDLNTRASKVQATRGQNLKSGFVRFPQVLGNRLAVAIDNGTSQSASLALAGAVVTALQRNMGRVSSPLGITVISRSAALSARTPVFVAGATPATANALRAPLRLAKFRAISSTKLTSGVGSRQPYITLQAFHRSGRDLLLSGGWAPTGSTQQLSDLSRALADRILAAKYGWSAWSDDLIVLGTDHRAVNLGSTLISPQPSATRQYRPYAWWLLAAGVLLIVVFILGWLHRRKRQRQRANDYARTEAAQPTGLHAQRAADTASPASKAPTSKAGDQPSADDPDTSGGPDQ